MCIIRQLINQHSIIDSYPMMALVDKAADSAPRKVRRHQDDTASGDTDPPTDDSSSYYDDDDDDDTSVLSEMEPLPPRVAAAPAPTPVMSDKIAQDVLVFKKIAERMPPQSLLHLLKADVLVNIDTATTPDDATCAQVIDAQDQVEKKARQEEQTLRAGLVLAPYRASKVRFALNEQGKLLRNTRFFEPVRDKSLWWQRKEMEEIRAECCSVVEDYTLHKKQFEADLTSLMDCANDANLKDYDEDELKCFADHQVARGLERHIVMEFESLKQFHFETIMAAQHEYKNRGTTERWKHLKKTSISTSLPTRYIAVRFAQNDQAIVRRDMAAETPVVVGGDNNDSSSKRPSQTKTPVASSRRNLRNFIKRAVSRRFSGTG